MVSFINEEKTVASDYYRILYDCVTETDISEVRNLLEGALTAEEFEAGIKPFLPETETVLPVSDELTEYLKKENIELKNRINELIKDLNESRQENVVTKEELLVEHRIAIENKLELERLRKNNISNSISALPNIDRA